MPQEHWQQVRERQIALTGHPQEVDQKEPMEKVINGKIDTRED